MPSFIEDSRNEIPTLREALSLHADLIATTGGSAGLRDLGRLQSALAQPMATFDGVELYPDVVTKAAALGLRDHQGASVYRRQ
jgi:prophage maintenance system killer protein